MGWVRGGVGDTHIVRKLILKGTQLTLSHQNWFSITRLIYYKKNPVANLMPQVFRLGLLRSKNDQEKIILVVFY